MPFFSTDAVNSTLEACASPPCVFSRCGQQARCLFNPRTKGWSRPLGRCGYLFSAVKALRYISLGQSPQGLQPHRKRALKARLNAPVSLSIPHISLVELNAVSAQQLTVFLLKSPSAMVLFLCLHVVQHSAELTRTHRKSPIPALPEKGMNRAFSAGALALSESLGRCPRLL
jgi:hypothetical protein